MTTMFYKWIMDVFWKASIVLSKNMQTTKYFNPYAAGR